MSKRVVITGMGMISPIGNSVEESWEMLKNGKSGIEEITKVQTNGFRSRIGGEIKNFEPEKYLTKVEIKRMDDFMQYVLLATKEAVDDSGYEINSSNEKDTGVIIGTGFGGTYTLLENHRRFVENGCKALSPFFIPMMISNMGSGIVSIKFGARGVSNCVVSACSSGTVALVNAYNVIKSGQASVMIAGGVEAAIHPLSLAGFGLMKALTSNNENPKKASRPFDKNRDGFVMSEGSGVLILEDLEHAKNRNAKIYAELLGGYTNNDGYHITAPHPDGSGAADCIRKALNVAGVNINDVDYINAHGTSTQLNDIMETRAIKKVFGDHSYKLAISSNKSMIGHLIGGAGSVEAIFTIKTIIDGIIPPTINLEEPDEECDLDYVPNTAREKETSVAISNSFAFGGINGTIVLKSFK